MTQEQYKLEMKDLIDNWQQRNGTVKTVQHKQEVELLIDHTQNFICDGVVCPEKWFSQSIRPLYLLKEAYGEGSWDLIADHLCKSGQISQMWRRVSKWTSGLLGTTENTLMPYGNWGDVDHYGNEYLQKIAVVNVKKSGGKSSSNMDEIRAYAQFDREELLRELGAVRPNSHCLRIYRLCDGHYFQDISEKRQKRKSLLSYSAKRSRCVSAGLLASSKSIS